MLREENFKQRVFQIHYAKEKISNTNEAAIGISVINSNRNRNKQYQPIIIFISGYFVTDSFAFRSIPLVI